MQELVRLDREAMDQLLLSFQRCRADPTLSHWLHKQTALALYYLDSQKWIEEFAHLVEEEQRSGRQDSASHGQ